MSSAGFEPTIPTIERLQSYSLNRTVIGKGSDDLYSGGEVTMLKINLLVS
jgi:hypothetical protein